ncbi:MAG TPA: head GIN domain-containing protein [Bacteroidia bacterium]|jgi:hypothetical protein|nr:head GIN domain-containing protein [Bacteroidia bacterium]
MKKLICIAASAAFFINASAQQTVKKTLEDFNAIEVNSAARVNLIQSDSNYVILTSKDPVMKSPKIEVHDGVLRITGSPFRGTMDIHVKSINSITASDAVRITCKDTLKSDKMIVHASDAGRIDVLVHAHYIRVRAHDAANVTLAGTTDSLEVKVSDASHVNGYSMRANGVNVTSSDGSNADVWATRSVNARATDGSNVHVKGSPPQRNTSASDGGSVKMVDTGEETTLENSNGNDNFMKMESDSGGKKSLSMNGDAFIGGGFVTGGSNGVAVKYGNSREFMVGFGSGHKFSKWNELGLDVYYKSTGYYLSQDSGKSFPDRGQHQAQKISFQNFGGLVYDRFYFGRHIFLDGGVYGDWTFHNKIVTWDDNVPNVSSVKSTERNLSFVNPTNYGVSVRFGSTKGLSFYFNYRLSKLLKNADSYGDAYPQLPAYVFGLNIGGF